MAEVYAVYTILSIAKNKRWNIHSKFDNGVITDFLISFYIHIELIQEKW